MAKVLRSGLGFLLAIAALTAGSLVLSLLYENLAGNESFSLPLASLLIVTVLGAVLFPFFGWMSTLTVLGIYAVWCIVGGLVDRSG